MPVSKNKETERVTEELSKALVETTSLSQTLLSEIHDNAATLAILQTKLESLGESVQTLSQIIRDGNGKGSLLTRLALIEKEAEDIAADLKEHTEHSSKFEDEIHARVSSVKDAITSDKKSEGEYSREKTLGFLKLAAVALPGLVALILKIIEIF